MYIKIEHVYYSDQSFWMSCRVW